MARALFTLFVLVAFEGLAQGPAPLLLQQPALNRTHIVFSFGGDLWKVVREGGAAERLTSGAGIESGPFFSPDGSEIAFTGEYDGNVDVFTVPAAGGVPKRLTWHPGTDQALGWTPDGKQVLFRSRRNSYTGFSRLFTLPREGGFPSEVPLPMAEQGAYSPDGSRLAYLPLAPAFDAWKRYRGGRTTPIWIATLADARIEKIPRDNSNDFNPLWIGSRIYFLSDRAGPVSLFAYDTASKKVTQALPNSGLDVKWASAGPGAIAYEQFGSIHLYDPESGKSRRVEIRVEGDLPSVRPSLEKAARMIRAYEVSPTGARAVFEARGEIFTVPAEKGDVRNLTNTPGVAERDPAWSPDGRHIAYFSDESGEYALHIREQNGMGEPRKLNLAASPTFYYDPLWSPDSRKICFGDKALNLYYVDLEKGQAVKVDTDTYKNPESSLNPVWSPDSKWLAYTKQLDSHLRAVFAYSLDTGQAHQVSDGMSDARYAAFDKDGKYLYFTASTDAGPTSGWLDMSSINRPVSRSVYAVVLNKADASPVAPESDEEKAEEPRKPEKPGEKKEPAAVRIDLENIGQRIVSLPVPARNYVLLSAGKAGVIYLVEAELSPVGSAGPGRRSLYKFELKTRKTDRVMEDLAAFRLSHNGEKMIFRQAERWAIATAGQAPKPGEGTLRVDGMEMRVDPRAEWRQMYREVWRIQRDFFYDPGAHGLDLKAAAVKYQPYVDGIAHRQDLNYLFREMLGELSVGHLYVGGGAAPEPKRVPGGLLGADYRIENGRYRFARVYNGENWNPQLKAPLTQPGVNVTAGEYLLAVNGRELGAADNVYAFFEGTAGKSVLIRVGPDPGGANSREATVVPVGDEGALRNLAWIEDNRRKVDQMSGGRLAYVYLPNTGGPGYISFNRYFYAQVHKDGAVIDERFNGGGLAADYIIDAMRRPLMNHWTTRDGKDFRTPVGAITGPKAMIVNEYAGSGGDAMPWYFRKAGIGPLVGKRTWGGLVGIFGFPELIDGGRVTAPNLAFYNTEAEWDVENRGVAPDIEVEFDPQAWRAGRDPQLEKAVEVVMAALKKNPPAAARRPAYPNYHQTGRKGAR